MTSFKLAAPNFPCASFNSSHTPINQGIPDQQIRMFSQYTCVFSLFSIRRWIVQVNACHHHRIENANKGRKSNRKTSQVVLVGVFAAISQTIQYVHADVVYIRDRRMVLLFSEYNRQQTCIYPNRVDQQVCQSHHLRWVSNNNKRDAERTRPLFIYSIAVQTLLYIDQLCVYIVCTRKTPWMDGGHSVNAKWWWWPFFFPLLFLDP